MPLLSTRGGGSARGFGMFGRIQAPSPILTNIQLYYDFNNTSSYSGSGSTTVNDLSGGGRTGTITGTVPALVTSPTKGLQFVGANSGVYISTNQSGINYNNNFTTEVWFRAADYTGWDWLLNLDGYGNGLTMALNSLGTRWSYGPWFTDAQGAGATCVSGNDYQYVIQRSGTTLNTFLNGALVGTSTTSYNSASTTATMRWARGPGGETFGGRFYLMRHYSSALTSAEVLQNFNAERGRFGI